MEVNWLVIIAKEEVGTRSDSYKSHPQKKEKKKKKPLKVVVILFRHPCLQRGEDFSLLSDETKINLAETLSFSKQGWKSS